MLQWVESCESTSALLKEQTKDNFSSPRSLAAGVQTAGRGRNGRGWVSQAGNLHLSVAIPASMIRVELRGLIPLLSAVIVAEWVKETFHKSICLKWPNDIFFDGKKAGGILCEASYTGDQFRGVVIGIGLNLISKPPMGEQTSDYAVSYLSSQQMLKLTAKDYASKLSDRLLSDFKTIQLDYFWQQWRQFAIKPCHLWITIDNKRQDAKAFPSELSHWSDCGTDEAGHLVLEKINLQGGAVQKMVISSVTNDHRWSLASQRQALVADVGNSVTKLALVKNDDHISIEQFAAGELQIDNLLSLISKKDLAPIIHCICVNPEGLLRLKAVGSRYGFVIRELQKEPVRLLRSDYDLRALGADRFAALEASLYLQSKDSVIRPSMVASLGTATTIDHIDATGRHMGGYIISGLQTSVDALGVKGRLLPKELDIFEARLRTQDTPWPQSTVDAIIDGAIQSTIAFLQAERQKLASHCKVKPESVNVYLTGGFAEKVEALWSAEGAKTYPGLALTGAALLAFNGR